MLEYQMKKFIRTAEAAVEFQVELFKGAVDSGLEGYTEELCNSEVNKFIDSIVEQDREYHIDLAKLKIQEVVLLLTPIRESSGDMMMTVSGLQTSKNWIGYQNAGMLFRAVKEIEKTKVLFDEYLDGIIGERLLNHLSSLLGEVLELLERATMCDSKIKEGYVKHAEAISKKLKFLETF